MHAMDRATDRRRGLRVPSALRQALAIALAVAAGLAIAWADSRPGWDSTGITASSLAAVAFVATAIAGKRPWLYALLTGVWTPAFEISQSGQTASIAALFFAAIGAGIAALLVRASRQP